MPKLRRRNKIWILSIVCVLFSVIVLLPTMAGKTRAAEHVDNTYALCVTTGNMPGDHVTYFGMEYVDTDGYAHVEYIFPHRDALRNTLQRAYNVQSQQLQQRQALLQEMGMEGQTQLADAKPLQTGQMDTYFIEPTYEVAQVTGLQIFCAGTQGQMYSWDVTGLRLYEVEQILGLRMNGYYSGDYTVCFNGQQIAYMQERSADSGTTLSWTGNTLYRFNDTETAHHVLVFQNQPHTMDMAEEYVLRIDIADLYGAGIEAATQSHTAKKPLKQAGFGEYLVAQIEYTDRYGDPCLVKVPVVFSTVGWMLEQGIPESACIAGIAQQGQTVAFGCYLREMEKITAVTLLSGEQAQEKVSLPVGQEASVSITGVSFYEPADVTLALDGRENSASEPQYTFHDLPLYYYTAANPSGEEISDSNALYMSIHAYETGAILTPIASGDRYLVELFANPSQITGVPDDLYITLKYVDINGMDQTTDRISVMEYSKFFYGDWPASDESFEFRGQVSTERGIRIILELNDVEHFTGLTVSVPMHSPDWRMQGFRVTRVDSLSQRYCVWEDMESYGMTTNRRYDRDVDGYMIFKMNEDVLIQSGNGYEMDFISNSVQETEDIDWSEIRYSMSYDQCTSNLGFTKAREQYTVEVKVRSGAASLDSYGDTGSKNRFYFLLEFENGDSGYVLANQQLGADGFRSGCTETFTVTTNYNYGELVAVKVIPDDISEGSDPYDKLNIEQICVRRATDGSVSNQWVIQNVGWIGIDYRDEGAGVSISGQQGRTEEELARIFPVSYKTYALNLEFMLSTGLYSGTGSGGSFYGTMEATLDYYGKDGRAEQITFDVIRAMYDYANRGPVYSTDGVTGANGETLAISDTSFMFRENHTDRFRISVSDVVRLNRITLKIKSLNGGSLAINELSVALVTEEGRLQINEQDEYAYGSGTQYLCGDKIDKVPACQLELPQDRVITQEIYFTRHEDIKLDTEDHTWISAVSREPASKNDTVNIYIYPASNMSGDFTLDAHVQYTDVQGRVLENGIMGLTKTETADGQVMFAGVGLGATGMSALNKVYLKAQSLELVDAYIDHVVIQQVRAGVVIGNYFIDFDHRNADMGIYGQPGIQATKVDTQQKVTLSLGAETELANLVPENRDIAVAIRYTTTNDPNGQEYTSKYIYLTDQQIWQIRAGSLVTLTFQEGYVSQITGILVATTGGVKAQIDMACVDTYRISSHSGVAQRLSHTSFATGATIENDTALLTPTPDTPVQPLDMELITAGADSQLESGTDAPIRMTVCYVDSLGVQRQLTVENIRDYVVSAGTPFATGTPTQIRLMLRDATQIRWVQFMPYDEDPQTVAGWKLSTVNLSLGTEGELQKATRTADIYIEEGSDAGRISFVNVVVTADVKAFSPAGEGGTAYRASSAATKNLTIHAASQGSVQIANIQASNSAMGCQITAFVCNGDVLGEDVTGLLTLSQTEATFAIAENTAAAEQQYRIFIASKETPEICVQIDIVVAPAPTPEATEPTA